MSSSLARRMWSRFEPIHDVTYFTPEALAAFAEAGLRGYWRGYFAGRAAPLGPIGAAPVIAAFYGFAPRMVQRAIPDVWTRATPEATLAARERGAVAALERILGSGDHREPADESGGYRELADELDAAIALLEPAGRVLGAANMALHDADAPPLERIWQACTTLREHRGDAHVAALLTYGFDGCESAVWRTEPEYVAEMNGYRGWTGEEWAAAAGRLTERGWCDETGAHTAAGDAAYRAVEDATDRAAGAVWAEFGVERAERLAARLTPLAEATFAELPPTTPLHLPAPIAA